MVMKRGDNNMIKVVLVLIVFCCACCADKLRLTKTPFTGNQLRMDGYYYEHFEDGNYYYPLILYSNGIVMYGDAGTDLKILEEKYLDEKWLEHVKNTQSWWGIYQIGDNSIKIEMWYHSNAWFFHAYIRSGKILNDTTFVLTTIERSGKPWTKEERYRKYHFKQFSPKPDSTNIFIK